MITNESYKIIKFINENAYNINIDILDEAAQTSLSDKVIMNMINLTIGKYMKIDMNEVSKSRGNITQFRYYKNLVECINTLVDIDNATNKIPDIHIIKTALENLVKFKAQFEDGFKSGNDGITILYNTITYAIMEATSYIIATTINFTKSMDVKDNFEVSIIQFQNGSLPLLNSIISFNKICDDGNITKYFNLMKSDSASLTESTVGDMLFKGVEQFIRTHQSGIHTALAVVGMGTLVILILTLVVPLMREIVYWIYTCRHKISDAAKLQSEFINCNIEAIKRSNRPDKDAVIAKQTKYANKFLEIANKFALESDKASATAKHNIDSDKVDVSAVVI